MKNNRKGFMLVEIIIVASVIMIGLVSLFTLVSKVFFQYNKKIVYDNVDASYVARGLAENFTYGLIKNDFANDSEINYLEFDTTISDDLKSKFENFIKKNNVVESYIVRYKKDSIENLLTSESNNIEQNLYDYIELYKDSNDFSDSLFVNTDDTAKTYNFIIFTAISDYCNVDGVCTEDNGNLGFAYYKFNYTIIENNDTEYIDEPPRVYNIAFLGKNGNQSDTDGWITWNANDYSGKGIKEFYIKVDGGEKIIDCSNLEQCKTDGYYDETNNRFKLPLSESELGTGAYGYSGPHEIQVFGVNKEGKTGKDSCTATSSVYCTKNTIVVGKLNFTPNLVYSNVSSSCPKINWKIDTSLGFYKGQIIKFDINHSCVAKNFFTKKISSSWYAKDIDGDYLKKTNGNNATGTSKTTVNEVVLGDKDFVINVTIKEVSK